MSSYALLGSVSGFRYSAATRTLWFGPKLAADPFRCFFSTASGHGTITRTQNRLSVELLEGKLAVERVLLTRAGRTQELEWNATVTHGQTLSLAVPASQASAALSDHLMLSKRQERAAKWRL